MHSDSEAVTSVAPPAARILLVHADGVGLGELRAALAPLGHATSIARSGREALGHLAGQDFAVVVMDVTMPEVDGYRTAALIRDRVQSGHIPIILVGEPTASAATQGYECGAVDFLARPVDAFALRSKVEVFVGLFQQRETIRRQQERLAAKDEFLAMLSHELRAPLMAIAGWTRMLLGGTLDADKSRRALRTIERNVELQRQIVEDLLEMSRFVAGRLRLETARVDLSSVVEEALETMRPVATAKQVTIEARIDRGIGSAEVDPHRLAQVVANLVGNAIKFTPAAGRVTVQLARLCEVVELSVSDTGIGIAADFLPYVFDAFTQADSSATRAYGGLGLGLAIVRHLVEAHGGTTQAESAGLGQGATMRVRFPVEKIRLAASPGSRLRRNTGWPAGMLSLQGIRVLVVDDEADARELMIELLHTAGAQAIAAGSAAEALALVERSRPHVIVSDIGMPGASGLDFIRRLRVLAPEDGGRIPAIALTGYASREDQARTRAAGFNEHLAKPVDVLALIARIATLTVGTPGDEASATA